MAVALEVGWGSGELGGLARMSKKRAWGDDHQKLLEMMMGKPFDESRHRQTLDLLGGRAASNAAATTNIDATTGDEQSEFLELGQDVPLPSGWEKRLDLKSGTVFFINWNTGKTTYDDPRTSSASSCHMSLELLQYELGKQHKPSRKESIQVDESASDDAPGIESRRRVYRANSQLGENAGLDLKLNLSSKQEIVTTTTSSSDVIATASDGVDCLCLLPPSAAAASSPKSPPPQLKVTLTGCKRCLMYVMITQSHPWCPRCKSSVIMDFPVVKKQRKLDLEL